MPKFQLVLLIHAHQPVGNFDDVLESAYKKSYLPFIETLARHPSIRLGLHYSGSLLEWLERAHAEYFDLLRTLAKRGQVEIVGGGFYEPILATIPFDDRHEQITRLADYIEKHFVARPRNNVIEIGNRGDVAARIGDHLANEIREVFAKCGHDGQINVLANAERKRVAHGRLGE